MTKDITGGAFHVHRHALGVLLYQCSGAIGDMIEQLGWAKEADGGTITLPKRMKPDERTFWVEAKIAALAMKHLAKAHSLENAEVPYAMWKVGHGAYQYPSIMANIEAAAFTDKSTVL